MKGFLFTCKKSECSLVERKESMLGLSDPSILLAFLLSIGGAVLCAAYGIVNWNKDDGKTGGAEK